MPYLYYYVRAAFAVWQQFRKRQRSGIDSMESLPVDVATLSELSDSSILSCLEERFRGGYCQSYVGQVLINVDPLWPSLQGAQGRLLAPEVAEDVLQGVSENGEDQSVVLSGYQGSGKSVVLHQLMASLIGGLSSSLSPQLEKKMIDSVWLLQGVTSHGGCTYDGRSIVCGSQALVGARLLVKENELVGGAFSCVLLNTSQLRQFSVFELSGVKERLTSVGVSTSTADQFVSLLVELDLLSEGHMSKVIKISERLDKDGRRQLAEQIYAHLVRWLVCHLNTELAPPSSVEGYCHIDIFDPPGVTTPSASSETGSLVDLIERYMNEVLHNVYCHRLFIWEQEQYIEDEVEWEFIDVQTNQSIIEAFQQSAGVLDALGCRGARDIAFAVTSSCHTHPDVCFTTEEEASFIVSHFTGELSYTITERWPQVNSLHLPQSQHVLQSLLSSTFDLLRQLANSMSSWSPDCLFSLSWEGPLSLTSRAKQTTHALLELITTSQPHFVLCLAPKPSKKAANSKVVELDRDYVLAQLQQFRVLDTALIQSCGYPVHLELTVFVQRYAPLLMGDKESLKKDDRDLKQVCHAICTNMKLSDYRMGNSQVFLKPWHTRQLDSELELFQVSARKLQQAFRRNCLRRQSERIKLERAVKRVMEERDEYDVVSTDSGSGEDEGGERDGDIPCPPSPPPRPKHTLSHRSFAIEEEKEVDERTSPTSRAYPKPTVDERTSPMSRGYPKPTMDEKPPKTVRNQSSKMSRRKMSWRKQHKPQVPREPQSASGGDPMLSQRSWYHGKVPRDGAERRLRAVSFDCFLVRESEKRLGEYSLSLKHKSVVKHFRVDVKRGSRVRYELFGSQKSFPALSDLIDYYTRHCITTAGETLSSPCPYEGTSEDSPPPLPPPRRKNLSSIRRKEPPAAARVQHTLRTRAPLVRSQTGTDTRSLSAVRSFDLSDESMQTLLKELEIEERIVDAARRMADMPTGNRKEKQQRRRSLQQAQTRLISLRHQYHTIQERRRFIEVATNNIPSPNRRISAPNFNIVH